MAIGTDKFLGLDREAVGKSLATKYRAENYGGYPDLTVAKPVKYVPGVSVSVGSSSSLDGMEGSREVGGASSMSKQTVVYRQSRVKIATTSINPYRVFNPNPLEDATATTTNGVAVESATKISKASIPLSGGNSVCHYELLTANDSIFEAASTSTTSSQQNVPKKH